jgi:hypothetical protein
MTIDASIIKLLQDANREAGKETRDLRLLVMNNHNEVMRAISQNREEFVIFKTRVNAKTALISGAVAVAIAIASLIIDVKKNNKQEIEPITYEQVDTKSFYYGNQYSYYIS